MDDLTLKACRIVCAKSADGFCRNAGEGIGCIVGRGTSDPDRCKASIDQHILSGNWTIAEAVLELAKAHGEQRYSEGVHDGIQDSER